MIPFSLSELSGQCPLAVYEEMTAGEFIERKLSKVLYETDLLEQLLNFSGFPEPCIKAKSVFHRRWQRNMADRLVREDVRIGYTAIKSCVLALQLCYAMFLVPPYSSNIARAIKKERGERKRLLNS